MINGVNLPQGQSASALFQSLLRTTANTFPALAPGLNENGGSDKAYIGRALIGFEALRAASPDRVEIAESISRLIQDGLVFDAGVPGVFRLSDYVRQPGDALPLVTVSSQSAEGLVPRILYEGRVYEGARIRELADRFRERRTISDAAARALEWVADQPRIDLRDQKVVLLGLGAEMSPYRVLSLGGATILGIDLAPASESAALKAIAGGTTLYPEKGADLLTQPRDVVETIRNFAGGDAVHLGLFAYAGGKAREIRLTAAMHAIVRQLDPAIVKSVGMYVSPTSVAQSQPEDAVHSLERLANPSRTQSLLARTGLLKPNLRQEGDAYWVDAIVEIQKASYLLAQYEKRLFAEALGVYGLSGIQGGEKCPLTVSANVAGITRTRSMQIPAFQAGFIGAPSVRLETYDPETTRWLSGLLYVQGILDPHAVGADRNPFRDENERAASLHSVQVHGGIYSYPYAVEGAITQAVLIGLGKKWSLIPPFLRSLSGK